MSFTVRITFYYLLLRKKVHSSIFVSIFLSLPTSTPVSIKAGWNSYQNSFLILFLCLCFLFYVLPLYTVILSFVLILIFHLQKVSFQCCFDLIKADLVFSHEKISSVHVSENNRVNVFTLGLNLASSFPIPLQW